MSRIRRISREILTEKIHNSALTAGDVASKKDIMSLMVRARASDSDGEKGEGEEGYRLSDEALVDQVVSTNFLS